MTEFKTGMSKNAITMHDDFAVYLALQEAKRGGNVHANLSENSEVNDFMCWDASSLYPSTFFLPMPYEPFKYIYECDNATFEAKVKEKKYAILFRVAFYGIRLRNDNEPVPYISKSKCRNVVGLGKLRQKRGYSSATPEFTQDVVTGEEDNGRVRDAVYLECTLTDIDARIIMEEFGGMYTYDEYVIIDAWQSRYHLLPIELRDFIAECYRNKTAYKNKPGDALHTAEYYENEYKRCKIVANGVYGLFAMAILRPIDIVYSEKVGDYIPVSTNADKYTVENKEKYEKAIKKLAICPRLGIWICAYGRSRLQELINLVGADDHLYNDTDSVMAKNWEKLIPMIDKLNEKYIKIAKASGACAQDVKGEWHYCGAFEFDKVNLKKGERGEFKALGSKKYAYNIIKKDDEGNEYRCDTHITLAGVPKTEGAKELQEAGGLAAFKPGMIFSAGKLRPIYHDGDNGTFHVYDYNGEYGDVSPKSGVCLVDVDYKLSYGETYGDLVKVNKDGTREVMEENLQRMLRETQNDTAVLEYYKKKYNIDL